MTQLATERELDGLFATEGDLETLFQFQAAPAVTGDPLASIENQAQREAIIRALIPPIDMPGTAAVPPKERSAVGEVAAGFGRGLLTAAEGIAGVGEAVKLDKLLGTPPLTAPFRGIRESEGMRPSAELEAMGAFSPGDWRWWAGRGSEAIGTLVPAMVPGLGAASFAGKLGMGGKAAMALAAGTGGAVAGAIEGGLQYTEMRDQLVERGYTLDEAESISRLGAFAYGLAAGIVEVVPMTQLLKIVPGGRKALLRIITSAGAEGGEEVIQEVLSRLTSTLTDADPEALVWDEEFRTALKASGALGAGAGGVVSTVIPGGVQPEAPKEKPKVTLVQEPSVEPGVADGKAPEAEPAQAPVEPAPVEAAGKQTGLVKPDSDEPTMAEIETGRALISTDGPPTNIDQMTEFAKALGVDFAKASRIEEIITKEQIEEGGEIVREMTEPKPKEPSDATQVPQEKAEAKIQAKGEAPAEAPEPKRVLNTPKEVVDLFNDTRQRLARRMSKSDAQQLMSELKIALENDLARTTGLSIPRLRELGVITGRGNMTRANLRKLPAKEPSRARTKEAKAAQQKEEGQPQAPRRKGRRYTKAEASRVLERTRNEIGGAIQSKLDRANEILEGHPGFDDESNVHGSFVLPLDALDSLTPIRKARIRKAGLRESGDYSFQERVLGADFMQQVVDEVIATSGGVKGNLDVLADQIIDNPQVVDADVWFAAYHRIRARTAKADKLHRPELFEDSQSLRENDQWTMLGDEWVVQADENGILWIANDEYALPLEHVGAIPMDGASLKRASLEKPVKGGQEGITPELAPTITGKQEGLFVEPTKSALQKEVDADIASKKLASEKDQADVAPTGPLFGARRGMVELDFFTAPVRAALKAGTWTVDTTISAARWLWHLNVSVFGSARDLLVATFGGGIRPFVGRIWQTLKNIHTGEMKRIPKEVRAGENPAPEEIINKLYQALQQAEDVQEQFEVVKTKIRAKQAGKIRALAGKGEVRERIGKKMTAMKGKIPKGGLTPLSESLDDSEIDVLLEHWEGHQVKTEMSPQQHTALGNTLKNLLLEGVVPYPNEVQWFEIAFGPRFGHLLRKKSWGFWKKLGRFAAAVPALPRTFKAMWDLSATFRQGWKLLWSHPYQAGLKPLFIEVGTILPFYGETLALRIDAQIRASEAHRQRVKSNLQVPRLSGLGALTEFEEEFQTRFTANIPYLRHLPSLVGMRQSERAFVTFLNIQRTSVFDYHAKRIMATDESILVKQRNLKRLAQFVNAASGRGNVNFGTLTWLANLVLFAPRYMVSQFEYPVQLARIAGTNGLRQLAARQLAGHVVGYMILGLMAKELADRYDWDVEFDINPRSPTFLKMSFGTTTIDFSGGFTTAARVLAQSLTASAYDPQGDKIIKKDSLIAWMFFFKNKLSPTAATLLQLRANKRYSGEEYAFGDPAEFSKQLALDLIVPISAETFIEVSQEHDAYGTAALGTAEFFGLGVHIRQPRPTKRKRPGRPTLRRPTRPRR